MLECPVCPEMEQVHWEYLLVKTSTKNLKDESQHTFLD